MRYRVEADNEDGICHIVRCSDAMGIGRALTRKDADAICAEMNSSAAFRDHIIDAVTDAIEQAFE